MALYYSQWAPVGVSCALQLCCLLPAYVWIITALAIASARRNAAARLLLGPAILLYGYSSLVSVLEVGWELGWQRRWMRPEIRILQIPFPLGVSDLIKDIFVLALLLFLVRRFSLARKQEERLAGEFEAARSVQSLLIPAAPPATPGFAVEHVYLPAQEVGGNFFQVLPGEDDSLLVVVGDVSGKGLKAAMTVSAIIGALRDSDERRPTQVLARLNRVLCGQIVRGLRVRMAYHFLQAEGVSARAQVADSESVLGCVERAPWCGKSQREAKPLKITQQVAAVKRRFLRDWRVAQVWPSTEKLVPQVSSLRPGTQ